ncbi:MAG: TrkH family potassium uptake protein [Muribaculaceae bacterium]|mgnify:CR=1 FL=1|nr:TrkH family potassium uptake protein [Muribaculaceae bacterium]
MKFFYTTINLPIIFRLIGWLVAIEGLFMLGPLAASLVWMEPDWPVFAITCGSCILVGMLMARFIRSKTRDMGKREGFLLTALVWLVFSFVGMIPFMLCEEHLSFTDAFFESMSGFTTTGATIVKDVEKLSHGILLWRAEMNWIGGMGIILFTLAVTPMLNHSGGMQMFNAEVTGITHEKLRPRVSSNAKGLWGIYAGLTVILTLLLWLGPMDFFDAICHAFSTISTGGFSTHNNSLGFFNSTYLQIVFVVFMFLGGVNFTLLFRALTGNFKALFKNETFVWFCRIILAVYLCFVLTIVITGHFTGIASVTIDPLFMVISTISSTGLIVPNFDLWGPLCVALLFVLMATGACAGSTSGGAKIDRFLFIFKSLYNEIYRLVHPNAVLVVRINEKAYPDAMITKVLAFLSLYVLVMLFGGILLTAMGVPVLDAFFSAFSCIGNTGIGAHITGYGSGYDVLPDAGKWVLSFVMLTGRLEIFTILILFTKGFWTK